MNNNTNTNNNQNNDLNNIPNLGDNSNLTNSVLPNLGAADKKEVENVNTTLSNEHVDLIKKDNGIKSFKVNPNVSFSIGKNLDNSKVENKKEEVIQDVEIDPAEAKAQKKKTIGVFVLFGIMFGVVFFLPQISLYFANRRDAMNQVPEITEGLLSCSYTNNKDIDETYSWDFSFKDNRVTRANLVTKTYAKPDVLAKLETSCNKLQQTTSQYEGLKVECSYDDKTFVKKEYLNLQTIVVDQAYTAYTEAGGVYPNFYGGENIHDIEKDMNAQGFKCKISK